MGVCPVFGCPGPSGGVCQIGVCDLSIRDPEPIPGQLTVEDALAETAEASQDGRYRDERAETDTK